MISKWRAKHTHNLIIMKMDTTFMFYTRESVLLIFFFKFLNNDVKANAFFKILHNIHVLIEQLFHFVNRFPDYNILVFLICDDKSIIQWHKYTIHNASIEFLFQMSRFRKTLTLCLFPSISIFDSALYLCKIHILVFLSFLLWNFHNCAA